MARIITFPCEIGTANTGQYPMLEGQRVGVPTVDTAIKRSPGASLACNSGAGNAATYLEISVNPAHITANPGIWLRFYFRFEQLPTTTATIMRIQDGGTSLCSARLTPGGKLQFWQEPVTTAQIGADSIATLVPGQWYRIEMYCDPVTSTTGAGELRIEGVTVASTTTANFGTSFISGVRLTVGWVTAPGASLQLNFDDGALNDSTGSAQTSWPGEGNVVMLYPISDNARDANMLAGAGATINLWDAANNRPPAGLAFASMTNTSQIKALVDNATDNYDANMTTYRDAGVPDNASIVLVQGVIDGGSDNTTAPSLAVKIVSNPAQAGEDALVCPALAAGTWASNWGSRWGSAQVFPSVDRGVSPVLRAGKRTASATVTQMVDFMGMAVEYQAPVEAPYTPAPMKVSVL